MILPALVVVLLVIGTPKVSADAPTWAVDYTRSRLGFSGTQGGSPFGGEFKRFDADIHFDPATLATSRVVVDIDMGSVDTGSAERDAAVRDRDWFAVGQFPKARFETTQIGFLGDGKYQAAATLTMRDIPKSTILPFTLTIDGDKAHAKGELRIVRTDWGIGQGQWAADDIVGRDVVILFDLIARRAP